LFCRLLLSLFPLAIRERPFNLQGGGGGKAQIFFPEFNIRLYDKNSESDYYFFSSTKIRIFFFSNIAFNMLMRTLPASR
jgi:hypothetical protein